MRARRATNQITYTYDGLMRVLTAVRDNLQGNLIESTTYTYDASSNIVSKVHQIAFTPTPGMPTPTPTATTGACGRNGEVTIDDLMLGVNITLGLRPARRLPCLRL